MAFPACRYTHGTRFRARDFVFRGPDLSQHMKLVCGPIDLESFLGDAQVIGEKQPTYVFHLFLQVRNSRLEHPHRCAECVVHLEEGFQTPETQPQHDIRVLVVILQLLDLLEIDWLPVYHPALTKISEY